MHPRAFSELTSLHSLLLSGNYIKSITNDHLIFLKNLKQISFIGNKLEDVDRNLLDGLKIDAVYLNKNVCIDKNFGSKGTPLAEFKTSISNCSRDSPAEWNLLLELPSDVK